MRDRESKKVVQRVGLYLVLQPRAPVSVRRGSRLWLLKSMFNTKNFICRLFWFNSSDLEVGVTPGSRKNESQ